MKKQHNKEDRDTTKEEKKDKFLDKIKNIDDLSWEESYKIIHDFCYLDIKLNLNEIKQILLFKNKDLIDLFLREYILFDDSDKIYLEFFINDNLYNTNTEFVSDLLYFATDLSLNINYQKILDIIKNHPKDQNYLVLAAINYISNNVKYYYIEEIVETFKIVINSADYFQSEQILASVTLYRITNFIVYIDFVVELVQSEEENLVFLSNLLKEESYKSEYFNLEDIKSRITNL